LDDRFVKVAEFAALPEGSGTSVCVRAIELALFRREGMVYAVENLCPHQHIPVLSEGGLDGHILTCPMHGWQFDITDGKCVHASCHLRTFATEIREGSVFVDIPEEEALAWW
jgi:nitrite reductase/ring-hydroxylating ferredoxin subunit